jgi:hypothetical protein
MLPKRNYLQDLGAARSGFSGIAICGIAMWIKALRPSCDQLLN